MVRLRTFIQEKNPQAARRAASRIKEAAQILNENPEAGRPVEEMLPFRDLIIPFGSANYILRYREEPSRVVIVRVRHNKEEEFQASVRRCLLERNAQQLATLAPQAAIAAGNFSTPLPWQHPARIA